MLLIRQGSMAEVEIYTNKGCSACVKAKQYLDHKKVNYSEIKLGKSSKNDMEYAIRTNNAKSVPQIFISGELIGGFDDLVNFDLAGELASRLGPAQIPIICIITSCIRFLKVRRANFF